MSEADSTTPSPGAGGTPPARFITGDERAAGKCVVFRLGQERLVERRGLEDLALKGGTRRQQADIDVFEGLRQALPGRASLSAETFSSSR